MPMSRRSDTIDYIADRDDISKNEARIQYTELSDQAIKLIEEQATYARKQNIMKELATRKKLGLKFAGGGYTPQKKARKAKLDYRKAGYFT